MYRYGDYYENQTAKMREMEDASRDKTPLWNLGEPCAERSARLDGSWDRLEAQYAWVTFCWRLWQVCNWAEVYGNLPDALEGDDNG